MGADLTGAHLEGTELLVADSSGATFDKRDLLQAEPISSLVQEHSWPAGNTEAADRASGEDPCWPGLGQCGSALKYLAHPMQTDTRDEQNVMTPIHLFCGCGYPVVVRAHWTGQDIVLLLYRGEQTSAGLDKPVTSCPKCGTMLSPATLLEQPPARDRGIPKQPPAGDK